jgi:3-oxoacyl-[acyl-carrier-protein] synthase II
MDPLTRLACGVVDEAIRQGDPLSPETALIASTSYGAIESTLRFIGGMAEFSDRGASPTPFTTSVHSSCAGALGEFLGLHGPCTTISQGGLGTLSALRWAHLILDAGRAPAVLVVVGDRHNQWSRRVIGELSQSRWPIGDGACALLVEPGERGGRELRLGNHGAERCLDGGALADDDEQLLAEAARGRERLRAPDLLGCWWPSCLLTALAAESWKDDRDMALHEAEDGQLLQAWLGKWRP